MKLVIADDHALFRDSLRSLLEAHGLEVLGEARNGREAVELARKLKPDVLLMDLSMPEMDGLAATRLISADQPEVKVVILTASDEDSKLFEAIKSGAQGYLLKNKTRPRECVDEVADWIVEERAMREKIKKEKEKAEVAIYLFDDLRVPCC